MVKRCYDVKLKISSRVFCCCNRRMNQICFIVTNDGTGVLNNAILSVGIAPYCGYCCNANKRQFYINNLNVGCKEKICINLPYPCGMKYQIKAHLNVDNVLTKEDCINI